MQVYTHAKASPLERFGEAFYYLTTVILPVSLCFWWL